DDRDEYPHVTQAHVDRATFRIGHKAAPRKQRVTILLDTGLIEYFKAKAGERGYQTLITPLRKGHSRFCMWLRCSVSQVRKRSCTERGNCKTSWTKRSVSKISKYPPAYTIICVRWVRSCSKASA